MERWYSRPKEVPERMFKCQILQEQSLQSKWERCVVKPEKNPGPHLKIN